MHSRYSRHKGKLNAGKRASFQPIKIAVHKDFGLPQHTTHLDTVMGHLIYWLVKMFCFGSNLFTITPWHGTVFLTQSLSTKKSLSDNTKTRSAVSYVEYLYENISLTEILSSLKVAKKHVHVYCFYRKHFKLGFAWHAWNLQLCPEGY